MNSLQNSIAGREICGNNYENLGKTVGSYFWKKKILLSYDANTGWNVIQLNYISILLRKLGFFKSTHLKTIVEEIKVTADCYNPILNKKIKALWKKIHPEEAFPRSYYVILGNSDPHEAEIKLFCEEPTNQIDREATGKKINKYYKSGDTILAESCPAGKTSTAKKHRQTEYVNPEYFIEGWNPKMAGP